MQQTFLFKGVGFRHVSMTIIPCVKIRKFLLLDINLGDWLAAMGEEIGNTLSSALANKLLDELGLTNFMNPVPCDRYTGIFADTVNGWNSKGINRTKITPIF